MEHEGETQDQSGAEGAFHGEKNTPMEDAMSEFSTSALTESEIEAFDVVAYVLIATAPGTANDIAEQIASPAHTNWYWPPLPGGVEAIVRWTGVNLGLDQVIVVIRATNTNALNTLVEQLRRVQPDGTLSDGVPAIASTQVISQHFDAPNAQVGHP